MGLPRVEVKVEDAMVQDGGRRLPGVVVTCQRCQHQVSCFGRKQKSVRRACVLLKEDCPMAEENYYHDPDLEDREA